MGGEQLFPGFMKKGGTGGYRGLLTMAGVLWESGGGAAGQYSLTVCPVLPLLWGMEMEYFGILEDPGVPCHAL